MKFIYLLILSFLISCSSGEEKEITDKTEFIEKQKSFLASYEEKGIIKTLVTEHMNYLQTVSFEKDSNLDKIGVETFKLKKSTIQDKIEFQTQLKAYQELDLTAFVSGRVNKLEANGSYIGKGRSILSIDGDLYTSSYEAASSSYKQAEQNFQKWENDIAIYRKLHKSNDISDDEIKNFELNFLNAQTLMKQSKMQMIEAKKRYQDALLIAPFSGIIGNFNLTVGQQISVGQYLGILADLSKMKSEISLSVEELDRFSIGDKALFKSKKLELNGRIESISQLPDPKTGSYLCIVAFPNLKKEVSVSGLYGKVTLFGDVYENIFAVGQDAIVDRDDKKYLFQVKKNILRLVEIYEAKEIGSMSVIEGQLNSDDLIVSRGTGKLAENLKVRIIK
jgi:membrane fusion protein, multidrug efflux system